MVVSSFDLRLVVPLEFLKDSIFMKALPFAVSHASVLLASSTGIRTCWELRIEDSMKWCVAAEPRICTSVLSEDMFTSAEL